MTNKTTFIHPTAIVEEGATIGSGCKIWHHCHIRSGAVLGEGVSLGKNVYVDTRAVVGDRVKIQNNVSVYQGVVIEEDVFVGPSVVFTNDLYPRAFTDWKESDISKTRIRRGASLGANSSILCGITVGEYALVGMGSVLVQDVGDYEMWVGNPAVFKAKVGTDGHPLNSD